MLLNRVDTSTAPDI
ncbi:TPA: hypothetical protein ACM6V9_004993, partial [Escherichia coli]|nr:hypothetical protein [Escherichia coli]MBB8300676.1 hypothetical protein [Escherichia coli]MBC0188558.1 hypothetical protein [Escherichia coli]